MYAFDAARFFVIPDELGGRSAEAVLEACLPEIRRAALRRLFLEEKLTVNGMSVRATKELRAGDVLQLAKDVDLSKLPSFQRKKSPLDARPQVLFEDESCLVLDKPSGLASVPDRNQEPSVQAYLPEWFPGQDLRIVHRLDRGTSGVLILGKGVSAARSFDEQFRGREVKKLYLALVRGHPMRDEFRADFPIGRTISRGRVRIGKHKGSREAITEFRVRDRFNGFALLEARPQTGRMHQIRAHLMWMRLPLAVDPLYKGSDGVYLSEFKRGYSRRSQGTERPLIDRLTLHALESEFRSPASGAAIQVRSETPKDLALVLSKLERYARSEARR